jgi:predicted  nucleic acid-binding Zn-ribbon protein
VQVGFDEELRLLGHAGEDEDDLMGGREELFGRAGTTDAPIDVDLGDGAGAAATEETETQSTGAKRVRPSTSDAWEDFDPIFKVVNGKKIRIQAKCIHCGRIYAATSRIGTGSLLRHIPKCGPRKQKYRTSQSQIQFSKDGSVALWEYSNDVARTQLCRLIARLDLPLSFGESDAFEDYIRIAHNPRFSSVSRQTTTRDFIKYYSDCRAKLVDSLSSVTSVALTSDIWSGNAKEDYLSVVAHYVNSNWELEKRVIGMRLIDESHSGSNIADRVVAVLEDFGLTDKVFSVTLDNASSNSSAMAFLSPQISGYMGTLFLHQRCACHIINLIVKCGLKRLKPYIEAFRTAISFLNSSNQRIAAYKSYCIAVGERPRKFGLDMDVRWNSTYLMLKHVVGHKKSFSVFIQTHYPRGADVPMLLTDAHWYVAEHILSFLELFYDSTVALSGVYYPTSPLILHHVLEIAGHLSSYENDNLLRSVVVPMKDKFLKYWRDVPMLYSIAFIMDPRAKMRGLTNALVLLSNLSGTDYAPYLTEVRAELNTMFNKYDEKFGAVRMQRPSHPVSAGKKKAQWGKIFGSNATESSSFGSGLHSSVSTPPSLSRRTSASALLQAATTGAVAIGSELSAYLDSDTVNQFDDDFNIINWWHEHKLTYPVLSIFAKDVLSVPVSTISSESAFSLTGRIIEERRRRLNSEMVEMLICIKDWEAGEARLQHSVEDKELEASFEEMFLDVE